MSLLIALLLAAADHPCAADAQKLCQGIAPGGGRIAACLKSHESELSAECKAKRDSFKERAQDVREACKDDADKFCKGVKPGCGRMLSCLKSHQKDLSQACAAQFPKK